MIKLTVSSAAIMAFILFVAAPPALAEDYSFDFDVSAYKKKPFEYNGHFELIAEHMNLNRESVLFKLNYLDGRQRSVVNRLKGALELETLNRWDSTTFKTLTMCDVSWDKDRFEGDFNLYQAYISHQPSTRFNFDIGKKTLKWGKGYAFTTVGFVERKKDPNDPDLSREGYCLLTANYTRSYESEPKTVSFTPVIVPVYSDVNEDFGETDRLNVAAKLYMLYEDTDIDFLFISEGSGSSRIGFDFSRNLESNLEIHGEWAIAFDQPKPYLADTGEIEYKSSDRDAYLLGFRYLTENNITTIVEYYHNGAGFSPDEMAGFYSLANDAIDGSSTDVQLAKIAAKSGFLAPNAMRNYFYIRSSWKEPDDIHYFTPAVNLLYNLDDGSFSITPEFFYSGLTDGDIRFRFTYLWGASDEEFGEKQNDFKIELKYRKYF